MSTQPTAYLSVPASYHFNKESLGSYRRSSIQSQNFHLWMQNDMYQSSYAKYHSPDSIEPRAGHLPGYAGFIPKNRAESIHAKTYANRTKQIFADPNINKNRSGLATTGFNITKDALVDQSKKASSHKYGKSQLQTPHPGWIPQRWISTTKETYVDPKEKVELTYRQTDKHLQTDKLATKTSGYQQNRAYWDGQGWNPNPILNPKNVSSEYRDRFNPQMQYHRITDQDTKPQLKAPEMKYSYNH